MVELRLLDGTRLDLKGDEVIALTYAVNDIGSIETRQGVSSNEFELPITDFNLNALGYPTNFNVNQNVNPFTKIGAEIFEDELKIAKGYIQITNPSLSGNSIPVVFFGENAEWFSLLKDKSIRELDLSDFKHAFNVTNVEGSFTNTEGYKYILADKNGNNFNQSNIVALQSWTLAVYQHTIIKKIFEEIGYKIQGTLLDEPLYKNTLIPDTNKKFRATNSERSQDLRLFLNSTSQTITDVETNVDFIVNLPNTFTSPNYNETTDVYTAADTFYANLRVSLLILNQGGTADVTVNLNINGSVYLSQNVVFSTPDESVVIESNDLQIGNRGYVLLNEGDTVDVTVIKTPATSAAIQENGNFTVDFAEVALEGSIINPSAVLPDIEQSEFVKDAVFDFNALVTANLSTKTISFNLKRYDVNNFVDWSNIIDLSEEVEVNYTDIISNYNRRNIVKRGEGDGAFVKDYNESNIIDFGNYEFFIDNDFVNPKGEIYSSPFASTYQVNSFNLNLYLPYFPVEIISDTFEIDAFSAATANRFAVTSTDIDTGDFEEIPDNAIYLLITDATQTEYNGIWTVTSLSETTVVCSGLTFTNNGTAIGRLIARDEEAEPRKLIDAGNFDVDTISSYTDIEVNSINSATASFTSIPYTYFWNPITGNATDDTFQSLSYGEISIPSKCSNLFEDYYTSTIDRIRRGKTLRAPFRLNQVDIFNLDFIKLVYLNFYINGQTIQGYFIVNKIEEYTGSEDSTVVELIKY